MTRIETDTGLILTHSDCKLVQAIRSIFIEFLEDCISSRLIERWVDLRKQILIIFIGTQQEGEWPGRIISIEFREFEAMYGQ